MAEVTPQDRSEVIAYALGLLSGSAEGRDQRILHPAAVDIRDMVRMYGTGYFKVTIEDGLWSVEFLTPRRVVVLDVG